MAVILYPTYYGLSTPPEETFLSAHIDIVTVDTGMVTLPGNKVFKGMTSYIRHELVEQGELVIV
jgi:hypothetical protein